MMLSEDVLQRRIEQMPDSPDHQIVWHICHENVHMGCASKLGQLATVNFEAPEVPDSDQEGMFLMRLHPLRHDVKVLDDGTGGIWLPAALSFPHSTVWHVPISPKDKP